MKLAKLFAKRNGFLYFDDYVSRATVIEGWVKGVTMNRADKEIKIHITWRRRYNHTKTKTNTITTRRRYFAL
jgi:hypothetical protein